MRLPYNDITLLRIIVFFVFFLSCFQTIHANGYRVQIGDQIKISLPGEDSLQPPFDVDKQGRIILPEINAVFVAGLTENELQQVVSEHLSSAFKDVSNLHIYVYKKQMIVTVHGYVKSPGEYTLSASSSIQLALHAAGGLRSGAQLDRIQLIRDGLTQDFNYKQYLDTGSMKALPSLNSLDIIFVPSSPITGNVEMEFDPLKVADSGDAAEDKDAIKVFGEVNSPGSFSHRRSINLIDLLMRAGGVTRFAGVEQIRVITQGNPKLFNLKKYLDTGDNSLLPLITRGATIFIPKQEEEIKSGSNMVYVMGEVSRPGAFEGKKGATFMDILANAGGPTRFAESRQIRIIKSDGTVHPFDLTGYTEGSVPGLPPEINPGDAIFVPEKTDFNEKSWLKLPPNRTVRIIGSVVRPGRVEWSQEMSLIDLLAHVGGPTRKADTTNIEIVTSSNKGEKKHTVFNLDNFINQGKDDSKLPTLQAGAIVRVHDLPQDPSDNKVQWVRQASDKSIYIFGQVGAPGRYRFTDSMNFLDILSAADGPTRNADLHSIRVSHRDKGHALVSRINLALYFETGDEAILPQVKTGDTIYIPEKDRIWIENSKESTIRVLGAINKPGRYRFNDSMTILDLLAQAGGTSANAYHQKITVVNLSCCKDQAQTFDLSKFSRTASFNDLPVLRAGDTVYIPNKSESSIEKMRLVLKDVFQLVSLSSLLGLI
ncbi:sugar ABC transporter substrate-binding protein [Gammaproteobacteria bacterium 42_54_T18]|mgnify:FL=1|nr:sugar ABC transporter substrate-binding protein [Gammaproteobacteria bacterium 42_54_T18]